jgi:hypothetical protein
MLKSGTAMSKASIPKLMGRKLGWIFRCGDSGDFSGFLERAEAQAGAGAIVLWASKFYIAPFEK